MSNPKMEKSMQKNNNAQTFTVENIVKKYIHTENPYNPDVYGLGFEYCGGDELIAQLYKDIAGNDAKCDVMSTIFSNGAEFYNEAITTEEYEFLKEHFTETVEYVISCRVSLCNGVHEVGELPNEAATFIVRMLDLSKGNTVYLPNAGYGDAIMLLKECNISGYVHSIYAWALIQIRLFAAGINADIECLNSAYFNKKKDMKTTTFPENGTIDAIIYSRDWYVSLMAPEYIIQEDNLFDLLKEDGKMVELVDGRTLCAHTSSINKKHLKSIVQFPCALRIGYGFHRKDFCALIYDKKKVVSDDSLDVVDLTCTSKEFEIPELDYKKSYGAMDVEMAMAIMDNCNEHVKHLEKKDIDSDILLPSYYLVNKSKFCHPINIVMTTVDCEDFVDDGSNLNAPVVQGRNLAKDFADSCIQFDSLSTVKNARSIWDDELYGCIMINQPCVFVQVRRNNDSNDIAVGYIKDVPASGLIVEGDIMCLIPKDGVSLETATLLLLEEFVQEQFKAIPYVFSNQEEMKKFLSKIVVWPMVYDDNLDMELVMETLEEEQATQELADELATEAAIEQEEMKNIAGILALEADAQTDGDSLTATNLQLQETSSLEDRLNAMSKEDLVEYFKQHISSEKATRKQLIDSVEKQREEMQNSQDNFEKKFAAAKAEYMDEVRSRKHDMMPHIRQISCARKNLNYYLLHRDSFDEKEYYNGMKEEVENMKNAVKSLSTYMEIFSREEKFGTPEVINIDQFLIEHFNDGQNYDIDHDTNYLAMSEYGFEIPELLINPLYINGGNFRSLRDFPSYVEGINVFIAKDDLLRLCENIIGNAVKHGFTDPERTDYSIVTELSVDKECKMFRIDFRNNGNPLPVGLDRQRYGLRGEKAGVTGGTGEGGWIVKSIVEHYNGDYDIFCEPSGDEFLTTVRIYLPIYNQYEK